jgi:hypothetical protein
MLCVINVNRAVELEFSLQVQGSTAKSVEPRFVIVGPEFAIVCLCTPSNDKIKVKIPKLEGILPIGTYDVRFEVILGDQIYIPIEDQIELKGKSKLDTAHEDVKPIIAASFSKPVAQTKECIPDKPTKKQKIVKEEIAEPVLTPAIQDLKPIEVIEPVEDLLEDEMSGEIAHEIPMPQLSLIQQVQQYKVPHSDTEIADYVAQVVKRVGTSDADKAGFSLIKKLTK